MRPSALTVAALIAAFALAQESRPATPPADAAPLIERLENESYEERRRAVDDLRALGESARPALEAHREDRRLETRTRVRELLDELDEAKRAGGPDSVERRMTPVEGGRGARPGPPPAPGGIDSLTDLHRHMEEMRRWQADLERMMKDDLGRNRLWTPPLGGTGSFFSLDLGGPGDVRSSLSTTRDGETVSVTHDEKGVRVAVRVKDGGEIRSYSAASLAELKEAHPELFEKYGDWGVLDEGTVMTRGVLRPDAKRRGAAPPAPESRPIEARPLTPLAPSPEADRRARPAPGDAGTLRRPGARLGVWLSPTPPILDKHLKLGGVGVLVENVEADSPAARCGLMVDDIVTHVGAVAVGSSDDFRRAYAAAVAAGDVVLKLVREGERTEVKITARGR